MHTEINCSTSRRGKKRLSGDTLRLASELIKQHSSAQQATLDDTRLAQIIALKTCVQVSRSTVRRLRLRLNIKPFPRGGARPGAGRPPADAVPPPRPRRRPPRISDEAFARWCLHSVYTDYRPHGAQKDNPDSPAELRPAGFEVPLFVSSQYCGFPVVRARLTRGQKGV